MQEKQIIFFIAPLLLANILHHFLVIKYNLFSALARPVDNNLMLKGKRLFGKNKTYRGFIVLILATSLATCFLTPLFPKILLPYPALVFGALLGFAYALGELPNSFIKRRLGIPEGQSPKGKAKLFFLILDNMDSVFLATLMLYLIYKTDWQIYAYIIVLGSVIHFVVDQIVRRYGYKSQLNK